MKSRSLINTWTRRPAKKEGEGTRCLPLKQPLFLWLSCLKWPHLFQVSFRLCIFHIRGKWKLSCVVQCARVIWYLSRHIPCMQFAFRLGLVDIKYLVKICIFKFNMLVAASWGWKKKNTALMVKFFSLRTAVYFVVDLLISLDQSLQTHGRRNLIRILAFRVHFYSCDKFERAFSSWSCCSVLISHHLTFYVITALLKHFVNVKRKTTLIFSCLRKIARVYVLSTASCELRT